jgi:hypothetical protein
MVDPAEECCSKSVRACRTARSQASNEQREWQNVMLQGGKDPRDRIPAACSGVSRRLAKKSQPSYLGPKTVSTLSGHSCCPTGSGAVAPEPSIGSAVPLGHRHPTQFFNSSALDRALQPKDDPLVSVECGHGCRGLA